MPPATVVYCEEFDVPLRAGPDLADVTPQIACIISASGVRRGSAHLTAVGSTASLTTIEYEPGAVEDLKQAIQRLAPPDRPYQHELAWHDGNGHSHVQAALLGSSLVVPIRDSRLKLGTWQQVVLINHDIHARRRAVDVTIIGET